MHLCLYEYIHELWELVVIRYCYNCIFIIIYIYVCYKHGQLNYIYKCIIMHVLYVVVLIRLLYKFMYICNLIIYKCNYIQACMFIYIYIDIFMYLYLTVI